MIISRTPFRVSFFGGGSDYPQWYRQNGGAVLATAIDKYCYISCRLLPPFFDYKHRLVYRKQETVNRISEIEHPAVRGVFSYFKWEDGVEIHHDGDLPARSGLGSSSSFTVGLINALRAMQGRYISKSNGTWTNFPRRLRTASCLAGGTKSSMKPPPPAPRSLPPTAPASSASA